MYLDKELKLGEIIGNNVYELKLHSTIGSSVEQINVLHYYVPLPLILSDFVDAWITAIMGGLPNILTTYTLFYGIEVTQRRGGTEFYNRNISIGGAVSGEGLPPFNCWDFTKLRGGVGERNGYIRFGAVPESLQANGAATGGALATLAIIANSFNDDITVGIQFVKLCIQRKHIRHAIQTPPRYFSKSAVQYSKIGSQNSRK